MPVNYLDIISEHLYDILDDVSCALLKDDEEYQKNKARMEQAGDRAERLFKDYIPSQEDRQAVEDYLTAVYCMDGAEMRALYKQGYRDCVTLLKHIGVL